MNALKNGFTVVAVMAAVAAAGADRVKLSVVCEDFLDGKVEFSCEAITGYNLMIDRVVLMADK